MTLNVVNLALWTNVALCTRPAAGLRVSATAAVRCPASGSCVDVNALLLISQASEVRMG